MIDPILKFYVCYNRVEKFRMGQLVFLKEDGQLPLRIAAIDYERNLLYIVWFLGSRWVHPIEAVPVSESWVFSLN